MNRFCKAIMFFLPTKNIVSLLLDKFYFFENENEG